MPIATIAALAATAAAPAAHASPREYGVEPNAVRATCPTTANDECSATGRVTGFQSQSLRGERVVEYPTRVRRSNGWLVAFSLTLGRPNDDQISFFNRIWGGPATARISVLEKAPQKGDRKNRKQNYRLAAQTDTYTLNPFFGKRAWFTLRKRIHVERGQILALTLPTWAPVLGRESRLARRDKWRASRPTPNVCRKIHLYARQEQHNRKGSVRSYRCRYPRSRLLYTALVVHKTPENKKKR